MSFETLLVVFAAAVLAGVGGVLWLVWKLSDFFVGDVTEIQIHRGEP